MIRKLNTTTAILLVTCLTVAPTALATDGAGSAWYNELIEVVVEWVVGGDEAAEEAEMTSEDPGPTDESGPVADPMG